MRPVAVTNGVIIAGNMTLSHCPVNHKYTCFLQPIDVIEPLLHFGDWYCQTEAYVCILIDNYVYHSAVFKCIINQSVCKQGSNKSIEVVIFYVL